MYEIISMSLMRVLQTGYQEAVPLLVQGGSHCPSTTLISSTFGATKWRISLSNIQYPQLSGTKGETTYPFIDYVGGYDLIYAISS
jgi:hypothetical protein